MRSLDHTEFVKISGVCERLGAVMMELCEFSLVPFQRNESFHSLDRLLDYFDKEELFNAFPVIGHIIASQMSKDIAYMHSIDMVHRDTKPSNILVTNHHYVDLKYDELEKAYERHM